MENVIVIDVHVQHVLDNNAEILDKNIVLRHIVADLEHHIPLTEEYQKALSCLFSAKENMRGCEKCFYECIIALHRFGNKSEKELAEHFSYKIR